MKNWKAICSIGLCSFVLGGCGNSVDSAKIYVLTPEAKASRFTADLAAIAMRHGFNPNLGQSTHQRDRYFVVEAKGRGLWLWGTNVPLSGRESPELCGAYGGAHPDPGQYAVTLDHSLPRSLITFYLSSRTREKPKSVLSDISKELTNAGYDVRTNPVECSPLSKQQSPGTP